MFAHDKKTSVRPAVQNRPNRTGLPDRLKSGVESLSGVSLDSIRVHYNSPEPARLQARAYAHGADIHVASGQEQQLPHEAWHAAQQLQGRVPPTARSMGAAVNDDPALEREADIMGRRAAQYRGGARYGISPRAAGRAVSPVAQLAKYGPAGSTGRYFSTDSFSWYFQRITTIKDSSWEILKGICFNRVRDERRRLPGAEGVKDDELLVDDAAKAIMQQVAAEFPLLEELFRLYWELAQFKFVGSPPQQGGEASQSAAQAGAAPPRKRWIRANGSLTDSAATFVGDYKAVLEKSGLIARYQKAIANEINVREYGGGTETPLYHYDRAYHMSPRSAQTPDQDAEKNIVLYRAMRPEEYQYLKTYIEQFKNQVDTIYDTTPVGCKPAKGEAMSPIDKINGLYNEFTRNFRGSTGIVLPIGSHLGDIEQVVTGYLHRLGEDERVVVKFVMRKRGDSRLGSFIDHLEPPKGGAEGQPTIIETEHREDRIGAKLERAGNFSLNVGRTKWASFMFLYFVDKIEVLNPSAVK